MNKRLRKKLHRGEFNWRGFSIKVWLREPWYRGCDRARDTAVIDTFERFGDFLLDMGMDCGGGLGDPWELWVCGIRPAHWKCSRRQQWVHQHCTEADRLLVEEFLSRMPEVDRFEVGEIGTGEDE